MSSATPILIVGAGPTGLALAVWLKMIDPELKFRIVSNAASTGTKSRAMVVHARSLEYYRQLGIADKVIAAGRIVESMNVMKDGHPKASLKYGEIGEGQSKYPIMLSLSQDVHEQLLLERLQELGGSVDWNTPVQSVKQEKDHVEVQFDGKTELFQYVAGCDGAHSAVRTSSNIEMIGGTYAQRFYVADLIPAGTRVPAGLELNPGNGSMTVVIPHGEEGAIRMLGAYYRKPGQTAEDDTFEDVRDLAYSVTKLDIKQVNWFSTYAVHHRHAVKFRDRRVFLVGDAAHLHSPVGGQGLNTGIGDASNLAWKLVTAVRDSKVPAEETARAKAEVTIDELLQTYDEERIKFAKTLVGTTDQVFTYVTQDSLIGKFIRGIFFPYILPILWKIPVVPPKIFERTSQVMIEYRGSALSKSGEITGTVQPGDRVPFVAFDGGRDNHEPLKSPGWHAHSYSEGATIRSTTDLKGLPTRTWPWTEIVQKSGLQKDKIYLVRPDGHIGYIGESLKDPRLAEYITKWCCS